MLPIPGLDGYGALEPHLSPETQRALEPAKQWGFFILLILLIAPQLNQWFFAVVDWFFDLSGVPRRLVADRQRADPVLVCLVLSDALRYMRLYAYIADMGAGHDHSHGRHPCQPDAHRRRRSCPASSSWS